MGVVRLRSQPGTPSLSRTPRQVAGPARPQHRGLPTALAPAAARPAQRRAPAKLSTTRSPARWPRWASWLPRARASCPRTQPLPNARARRTATVGRPGRRFAVILTPAPFRRTTRPTSSPRRPRHPAAPRARPAPAGRCAAVLTARPRRGRPVPLRRRFDVQRNTILTRSDARGRLLRGGGGWPFKTGSLHDFVNGLLRRLVRRNDELLAQSRIRRKRHADVSMVIEQPGPQLAKQEVGARTRSSRKKVGDGIWPLSPNAEREHGPTRISEQFCPNSRSASCSERLS